MRESALINLPATPLQGHHHLDGSWLPVAPGIVLQCPSQFTCLGSPLFTFDARTRLISLRTIVFSRPIVVASYRHNKGPLVRRKAKKPINKKAPKYTNHSPVCTAQLLLSDCISIFIHQVNAGRAGLRCPHLHNTFVFFLSFYSLLKIQFFTRKQAIRLR